VGTRFREVLRLGPLGRFTVWSEVLTLERPRCLEERFWGPGMHGHLRYTLTVAEAGRTVLRQQQTFVVTGPLASLQAWGIRWAWRPRASARLRDIRDQLEATAHTREDLRGHRGSASTPEITAELSARSVPPACLAQLPCTTAAPGWVLQVRWGCPVGRMARAHEAG
jgi:hypothetical protein